MKTTTTTIYTNGKSLFTLENYDMAAGVCYANGIEIYSKVDLRIKRAMHERGQLFYIEGMGDRKELKGVTINKKSHFENFKVY